jgi:predicted ester cyclase
MKEAEAAQKIAHAPASPPRERAAQAESVLHVEKHDYTDLRPAGRPHAQGMEGFEPVYTDIVDYIVRCTHRIWDEKNIGLIYSHYTHNAVVYTAMGATHSREEVVRGTLQRIAEYPERRGIASQVIWGGDDREGFYTSHLVTSVGRHTAAGPYGPPTGRSFTSRTIADCMVYRNRIYREWLIRDGMGMLLQLGIDPDVVAEKMAADHVARGNTAPELGDAVRLLGQEAPQAEADTGIAGTEEEAALLQMLHTLWNWRDFSIVRARYAPQVMWHGPRMRDLYGTGALTHQLIALLAMLPDASWTAHHICSVPSNERGRKFAVRWTLHGHHMGWGAMGAPTGKPVFVLGASHFHIVDGRIVEEFSLWDELAMRAQIRLPAG